MQHLPNINKTFRRRLKCQSIILIVPSIPIDFLKFSQLDFGEGLEIFEAAIGLADRYSSGAPTTRGQFEVRIDALDGPVIGLLMVQPTGACTNRSPQSTPITRTRGVHDVYFTFRTNGVGDLEWFTFKK